jgi:hypothetical protein
MYLLAIAASIYLTGGIGIFSYGMYGIKVDEEKHKIEGTRRDRSGDIAVPIAAIFWPILVLPRA